MYHIDPEPLLSAITKAVITSPNNTEQNESSLTTTTQDIALKARKISVSVEDTFGVNEVKVEEYEETEGDDGDVAQKVEAKEVIPLEAVVTAIDPASAKKKKKKTVRDNSDLGGSPSGAVSAKKKPRRRTPLELLLADSTVTATLAVVVDRDQDYVRQAVTPVAARKQAVPQTGTKAAKPLTRSSRPRTSL